MVNKKHVYGRIYCVTNLRDEKKYVGKTVKQVSERWKSHCRLRALRSSYLQKAIKRYGAECFVIRQLAVAYSLSALNRLEREWIARFGTLVPAGYNLIGGGEGAGTFHPLSRAKIRRALAKPEVKGRLSEARKALWATPDYRKKVCGSLSSGEGLAKKRAATKAQWADPLMHTRMRELIRKACGTKKFRLGRSASAKALWAHPGYRESMSSAMRLPEYRANMSAKSKARWTDPVMRAKIISAMKHKRELSRGIL